MDSIIINSSSLWIIVGLTSLVLEMLSGKFVLIFFSIGALCVALTKSLVSTSVVGDVILFSLISLISLFLFREKLQAKIMPKEKIDIDKGIDFTVHTQIKPHQHGQVTYQGAPWNAMNVGDEIIENGDRVTIVEREGNKLLISKIY